MPSDVYFALMDGIEMPFDVEDATNASEPSKTVVLVCHLGRAGYNVQRALSALGIKSHVVADRHARSLLWSRDCKTLCQVADINAADPEIIADAINRLHRQQPLLSVIPTDTASTYLVSMMRPRLQAPIFPIPDAETLRLLDNKWSFTQLCLANGIAVPKTVYIRNNGLLSLDMIADMLPVIVKPAVGFGQRSIVILTTHEDVRAFQQSVSHPYPCVVQEIVDGEDWALGAFAIAGDVTQWVTWKCPAQLEATGAAYGVSRFQATQFTLHEPLIAMGRKIIAATRFTGVINFDARLTSTGQMIIFEANPRFFNRMLAARMCGVNVVAAGLPGMAKARTTLEQCEYYPWQEMFRVRGWRLLRTGHWKWQHLRADLAEMLHDPLPPFVRKLTREETKL